MTWLFACGQLSLFLHNLGHVHVAADEHIFAYYGVRGTHEQDLSYCDPFADNCNVLVGWVASDSDFAAMSDTSRSVTRYIVSLNGTPISS